MAVELAEGYVSLLPSMQGFGAKVARELSRELPQATERAGGDAQAGFSKGFLAKAGLVAIGAAAAATITESFGEALGRGKAQDKLAAQLGLPPERSRELGRIAGSLYGEAYGESITEVNTALRGVLQSGLVFEDVDDGTLEALTAKALDLAAAFDVDVAQAAGVAGQLIRTGLAQNADEALDIMVRGFQQGADRAGDLLDTFTEYGTQFRKLGIDGAQATGLLVQGLQAGARDADVVADAIKEFSIRAVDGSELTAEGFQSVGLDAAKMAKAIAKGGPEANKALDETLDRLRAVEDPVLRSQAAVALFGTQAEDLGEALFALDVDTATRDLGELEGAAASLGDTLNSNASTKIEAFKRQALGGLTDFIGLTVIPGIEDLVTLFQEEGLGGVIDEVSDEFRDALPEITQGLGNIAQALGEWVVQTAPVFGQQLLELGGQLVAWVGPQIPPLLAELGHLMVDLGAWFLADGVPLMVEHTQLLASALVGWVLLDALPGIIETLPDFVAGVTTWLDEEALPELVEAGKNLGAAVAEGFFESLTGAFGDSFDFLSKAEFGIDLPDNPFKNPFRREHGGPVRAGNPYIVGERRPELFVPDVDGTILPSVPSGFGAGINIGELRVLQAAGEDSATAVARELRRIQLLVVA